MVSFIIYLTYLKANSADTLRLSGEVTPIIELDLIEENTFGVRSNKEEDFRYEISHDNDYDLIKKHSVLKITKKPDGHNQKYVYLSIIAR